ncbi:MAG: hypothetical protein LBE12_15915, partial [Planctomycetaceae bacterium]|nr:hypothetical protein [Planctomycetaceae bacterium]
MLKNSQTLHFTNTNDKQNSAAILLSVKCQTISLHAVKKSFFAQRLKQTRPKNLTLLNMLSIETQKK